MARLFVAAVLVVVDTIYFAPRQNVLFANDTLFVICLIFLVYCVHARHTASFQKGWLFFRRWRSPFAMSIGSALASNFVPFTVFLVPVHFQFFNEPFFSFFCCLFLITFIYNCSYSALGKEQYDLLEESDLFPFNYFLNGSGSIFLYAVVMNYIIYFGKQSPTLVDFIGTVFGWAFGWLGIGG